MLTLKLPVVARQQVQPVALEACQGRLQRRQQPVETLPAQQGQLVAPSDFAAYAPDPLVETLYLHAEAASGSAAPGSEAGPAVGAASELVGGLDAFAAREVELVASTLMEGLEEL